MKYPPSLPTLNEPNYILTLPGNTQVYIVYTFKALTVFMWYLVFKAIDQWSISSIPFIALFIFASIFSFFIMSDWMKYHWIFFAADVKGCYFRKYDNKLSLSGINKKDYFTFIPWSQISDIQIGLDSENAKSVLIYVNVDDEVWERDLSNEIYLPRALHFLKTKKKSLGRAVYLANQFRSCNSIIDELKKLQIQNKKSNV